MAKTKTPFFSLGSQGTVGGALTSQRLGPDTVLREKPIPAYRRTLPQMYQRWLYEDYAYLWTQQSAATKQTYASAGVKFHLTGFQYWMKYHLTNLPDIVAMYYLDERAGATALDFSRNSLDATIVGASPGLGQIDSGQWFDGLNDHIDAPNPSLIDNIGHVFTIEAFVWLQAQVNDLAIFGAPSAAELRRCSLRSNAFEVQPDGVAIGARSQIVIAAPSAQAWHHMAGTYDGSDIRMFLDGAQVGIDPCVGKLSTDPIANSIGYSGHAATPWWFNGYLDHVIIHTRNLNTSEILRHSLRRYPA